MRRIPINIVQDTVLHPRLIRCGEQDDGGGVLLLGDIADLPGGDDSDDDDRV